MAVVDIFSKRQARLRGDVPDVFVYDDMPNPLRVQIWQITERVLGSWLNDRGFNNDRAQISYRYIVRTLRAEYGVFSLSSELLTRHSNEQGELRFHVLNAAPDKFLDAVELIGQELLTRSTEGPPGLNAYMLTTIDELNSRFREKGVGYEFNNGQMMRVDSQLIHAEAVKPALAILTEPAFAGPQDEFLRAYEHYRHGNNKEALADALKAIESVLKVILARRQWPHNPTDPAKKLIDAAFANGLIPSYWQSHFTSLQNMLTASVPTVRNKEGGHGQGGEVKAVPHYLVSYTLHMTAATILFLVNADKALA